MGEKEVRICWEGGSGQFLPLLGEWEQQWPPRLKVVLYFCGLVYCFVGVSIVADMFMGAIERITSRKRVERLPGSPHCVTCTVWNETVANLTLMALGSSAPEILLSLNDIIKQHWFSGKLGPSTIVGSAAFNLFVIVAVCVNSVPDGEVRKIKETGVFGITAAFSIFAYLWVLFIVQFNSTNVIEVWEGVVTFMFFPILVFVSYSADVGWLSKQSLIALCWGSGDDEEAAENPNRGRLCSRLLSGLSSIFCMAFAFCKGLCGHPEYTAGELDDVESPEFSVPFDPQAPILDAEGVPISSEAGILTFKTDFLTVSAGSDVREYAVPVFRKNGTCGRVSLSYKTEMMTATPGYDYEELSGELQFRDGMTCQEIMLTILPKRVGHLDDEFQLILEDGEGGVEFNPDSDGGEDRCVMTVKIVNENPGKPGIRIRLLKMIDTLVNLQEMRLGREQWADQVTEAIYLQSEGSDEGPTCGDRFLHWLWFPWQIIFAVFTPPPTFFGGWISFWFSLLHIGWITVIISDLAELFGCSAGVPDEITAITFVALGTSVPDLFASRTAAKQDEYADASIVNVTGSNSVNVFLGIGLPWMSAAIYWYLHPDDPNWLRQYEGLYARGSFVVKGGNLAYSVAVFTLAAFTCICLITMRRIVFGGELGGPSDAKAYSSFFLLLLWFAYITCSVWQILTDDASGTVEILSAVIAVVAIGASMVIFAFFRQLLKISKNYIGEEGFWGIFVAVLIIGGRMGVFVMFQYQW